MEVRPHRTINRKKTKKITLGNVIVGGGSPITVQSMTNTLTTDIKGTIKQTTKMAINRSTVLKDRYLYLSWSKKFINPNDYH